MKIIQQCANIFLIFYSATIFAANAKENLKNDIQYFMQKNNIPGIAVEIYHEGEPKEFYFGFADKEKQKIIDRQTIFELGSLTKLWTNILIATQIDRAKIQMDDPLSKYLPNLPKALEKITLKHLGTFSAGLAFNLANSMGKQQNWYENIESLYPKNEQWLYSNVSIGLLGEVLRQVTQKNADQIFRYYLFNPIGMQVAGFNLPDKYQKNYAQGYNESNQKVAPVSLGQMPEAYAGKASANDMRKFLAASIGLANTPPTIFYPIKMTQVAYLRLPVYQQGLGWRILSLNGLNRTYYLNDVSDDLGPIKIEEVYERPNYNGDNLMEKTGSTNGFVSYIGVIPNQKSGIVILANKKLPTTKIVKMGRSILFSLTRPN